MSLRVIGIRFPARPPVAKVGSLWLRMTSCHLRFVFA